MALGIVVVLNLPSSYEQVEVTPTPAPKPTRVPFEQPTSAPSSVPDVAIEGAVPTGLEFPSVGFNSANLVLPPGQTDQILKWTEDDNTATGGALIPPWPDTTSIVYDSTAPGGGLIGTDVLSSVTIAGHTSPFDERPQYAVFQPLMEVKINDPGVVVTEKGRICATVIGIDTSIRKDSILDTDGNGIIDDKDQYEVDAKYRYATPVPDVFYVILCNRLDNGYDGPTTNLRVLIMQVNQGAINAGSC